jgi:hypothetical protein
MQQYDSAASWSLQLVGSACETDITKPESTAKHLKTILQNYAFANADLQQLVAPAPGYFELVLRRAIGAAFLEHKLEVEKIAHAASDKDGQTQKLVCLRADLAGQLCALLESMSEHDVENRRQVVGVDGQVEEPEDGNNGKGDGKLEVATLPEAPADCVKFVRVRDSDFGCIWLKASIGLAEFENRHSALISWAWETMLDHISGLTKGALITKGRQVAVVADKSLTTAPKELPIDETVKSFVSYAAQCNFGNGDAESIECFKTIEVLCRDRETLKDNAELKSVESARLSVKDISKEIYMGLNSYPITGLILRRADLLIAAFGKEHPPSTCFLMNAASFHSNPSSTAWGPRRMSPCAHVRGKTCVLALEPMGDDVPSCFFAFRINRSGH